MATSGVETSGMPVRLSHMAPIAWLRDVFRRRGEGTTCRAAVELMTDYLEGVLAGRDRGRF
jgi:hypothetical protein